MMRSMSSAVSGLKAQQTAMDVIGNNIANVNTNGFSSSSAHFEDLFYQNLKGGSAETNPSQVGYGAQVSDISKNMGDTGATTTDKSTDLYISGDGYFAVCTSPGTTSTSGTFTATSTASYYTRVGNFHFDSNGYLCDSNGNYVMACKTTTTTAGVTTTSMSPFRIQGNYLTATATDSSGTTEYYSYPMTSATSTTAPTTINATVYSELRDLTFNSDGSISATLNGTSYTITTDPTTYIGTADTTKPTMLQIGLANFVNEDGLTQVGNNYYQPSASSGAAGYSVASGTTEIESGALQSSNVNVASEFTTMITTQRGFQACSRVITTSDTLLEELINLKRS
jgi:flagellar hook protein FlgE